METRLCKKCGQVRPLSEFYTHHKAQCKKCRSEHDKAFREKKKNGETAEEDGPKSRGDVAILITQQNWDISPALAESEKRKFLLIDTRITKIQASAGREGPPPPCRECPAKIVAYCAETGTECQKFLRWAGPG